MQHLKGGVRMPASKPIALVKGAMTKKDIEFRKAQEKSATTGVPMMPAEIIKNDKIAYAEFKRIKNLLSIIDKDDDIYSASISRYCLLKSEEIKLLEKQSEYESELIDIKDCEPDANCRKAIEVIEKRLSEIDKEIMSKRRMQTDLEKENLLTVQSVIRNIPKKPYEEEKDEMEMFLAKRKG
jgi:predicted secreted Zn-dependent protease